MCVCTYVYAVVFSDSSVLMLYDLKLCVSAHFLSSSYIIMYLLILYSQFRL